MDEKERRDAFNMKVLKRHDPGIVDIVGSAAFVVLYELEDEWTKSGIEGPMFLYRRSSAPFYGFFVLNRNGVENFDAKLQAEDDVELAGEFVHFRATSNEQVLGIWVYDTKERETIGNQMMKIHEEIRQGKDTFAAQRAFSAQSSSSPAQPAGQSISLDTLFGTAASNPQSNVPPTRGPELLDSIFQSTLPQQTPYVQTQQRQQNSSNGTDDLKAMLGLTSKVPPVQHENHQHLQQQSNGSLPQGLEAIFASARSPNVPNNQPQSLPTSSEGDVAHHSSQSSFVGRASEAIDGSFAARSKDASVLSQRDFVREVLSLIHVSLLHFASPNLPDVFTDPSSPSSDQTDKGFVNDLYQRYLSRIQS